MDVGGGALHIHGHANLRSYFFPINYAPTLPWIHNCYGLNWLGQVEIQTIPYITANDKKLITTALGGGGGACASSVPCFYHLCNHKEDSSIVGLSDSSYVYQ